MTITTHLLKTARLLLPAIASLTVRATAQSTGAPHESALFRTIAALDSAVFESYNKCDLPKFASFFADSLEFYHDKTGLMVGAGNLTEAIKQNICGKVTRELVPKSLEVYPMNGYGAVEIGVHRFHHPNRNPDDVGEAKFIQLWQEKAGVWKITRVISFDH